MTTLKIAVTMDEKLLKQLDFIVKTMGYPDRSRAIQEAVSEKLRRIDRSRLARECEKLDSDSERQLAEEGLEWEADEWPEY